MSGGVDELTELIDCLIEAGSIFDLFFFMSQIDDLFWLLRSRHCSPGVWFRVGCLDKMMNKAKKGLIFLSATNLHFYFTYLFALLGLLFEF